MTARPLSVAMIGQRGIPASFGGIERAVEEIGSRLAARGHDITVYCRNHYAPDGAATGTSTHRGMRLRFLPAPEAKGLEAFAHSGISTLDAVARRHDVVHFHALGPGIFSPIPRLAPHTAVVQTIHGLDDQRAKWGKAASAVLRMGKVLSATVPDATIVVSQALRDHYRDEHQRHAYYIPNGVTPVERPTGRDALDRFGLDEGRYALFVGRLVPEKRIDLLIEAFAKVDGDVRLVIAGGSSHSDQYVQSLRDQAAADDRVIFAGYVYGDELQQLYRDAGAFVLPSDLEGLPLVLLEAVNMGSPLVVSDIEPHLEVVGHSAPGRWVFPRGDAGALADALRHAFGDRATAIRGMEDARADVLSRFDWDDVADRTEALYRSLIRW